MIWRCLRYPPKNPSDRREQIRQQFLAYCSLDTLAMVELWKFFLGLKKQELFGPEVSK